MYFGEALCALRAVFDAVADSVQCDNTVFGYECTAPACSVLDTGT